MADNATPIETLLERAENYGNSTIELLKLKAIDKSADIVSSLLSRLFIFITVALSLFIVNIGLALWLGKLVGDSFFGFFIIGGFYGIVATVLHLFRHQWIKYPLSSYLIKQMLK